MKPTAMLYRNLMAMDVEETIRAYPLDAVVLIGGCDKTVPAQLMGAASVDVPAIMLTGGPVPAGGLPRPPARRRHGPLAVHRRRARRAHDAAEYDELEAARRPSPGHCVEMGTASTMASLVEALGMSLPGSAAVPPSTPARAASPRRPGGAR